MGIGLTVLAGALLVPAVSWAQNASVAGLVRDASGGVLPGVTVEAASPALIEKVRTVTTDAGGLYNIIDLRPGIYSVTFTLPGFKTVVREGLELNAGGTLNVVADLEVGGVEERITVTGQAPQVDIRNVQQHQVITLQVIESLPTARTIQGFTNLVTPGVKLRSALQVGSQEVGGNIGDSHLSTTIHGSRISDSQMLFDGMRYNNLRFSGGGSLTGWLPNGAIAQEVVADVGGHNAEAAVSGPRTNPVPKDGGNTHRFQFFGAYTGENLQSGNITPKLVARGARQLPAYKQIWEANPTHGGPIVRDKLWFFGSYRYSVNDVYAPGAFWAKDPLAFVYEPDLSRPAIAEQTRYWYDLRLTWQASQRHKFATFFNTQNAIQPLSRVGATNSPEASMRFSLEPARLFQATYSAPLTNKLLVEAGFTAVGAAFVFRQIEGQPPLFGVQDLATGINFRAPGIGVFGGGPNRNYSLNLNTRAKVSYVTGSHAFAVGLQTMQGNRQEWNTAPNDRQMILQLRNGVPVQVAVWTTPYQLRDELNYNLAPFAQDQWTMKRLTMNLGVRFDLVKASTPAQNLQPTLWVGARNFPAQSNLPNWKDVSPRLGAAYDVFGDGRTALKASLGRYVGSVAAGLAETSNPILSSVNNTTRPWTDRNGDFVPQDDELGPLANENFGRLRRVTNYDPDYLEGWGKRWYDWELQTAIQHQLTGGVAVNATYTRHSFYNQLANDNTLVQPTDYSPFCVTVPTDTRLSNSGQQLCGFYDVNPNKFGQFQNVLRPAKDFGDVSEVYQGLDLTTSVRLARGITVQGGLSTGRTVTDICDMAGKVDNLGGPSYQDIQHVGPAGARNPSGVTSPGTLYCRITPPLLKLTDVKMVAVVPLPWGGVTVAASAQSIAGPEILANRAVTTQEIESSLGRPLAGGTRVITVPLLAPGTLYGDRVNQIDVRTSKTFRPGRMKMLMMIDLYNLFNVSPVLSLNNTYGPAWQRPTAIMPGRVIKFGTQVDF